MQLDVKTESALGSSFGSLFNAEPKSMPSRAEGGAEFFIGHCLRSDSEEGAIRNARRRKHCSTFELTPWNAKNAKEDAGGGHSPWAW
jgi:hypothetical protein